ncbi:hypothetical protein DOY81_012398 [Sarcophaga bullata]|nr:hypothetical protein DOY81_012398 [Sarcophaga bullata]
MLAGHLKVEYEPQKKIWKSSNYPYNRLTNRSISEAFLQSMRGLDPQQVLEYHYDSSREKRVKDIYQESITVAQNLQRLGLSKGDVVVLVSGNNYMTSVLTLGHHTGWENTAKMFETLQPFMILYEEMFCEKLFKALKIHFPKSLKHILAIDRLQQPNVETELLKAKDFQDFDRYKPVEINNPETEVAFLVLTSGTTDLPKVTQLTHCLLLNGVYIWWENDFHYEPLQENSSTGHIKRICANRSAAGLYGLEIIKQTKPTHLFAVPSFFHEVLLHVKQDDTESLDSLKYIQLGGESPSSVIIDLSKQKAVNSRLFYSYGMSEVAGSITNDEHLSGGKLQPGYVMQVLDHNLEPLSFNHKGQLAIKTPYPFIGYKGRDNSKCFLENGFFLNGDFGYFDQQHTLHVLGRVRDLIKHDNILLIPSIVEPLVLKIPEIASAC